MKRSAVPILGAAILALAFAATALAAGKAPAENYYPGAHVDVMTYVDTVTASSAGYVPAQIGVQTNFFPRTAAVKFRMWAVETGTGKVLTKKDVRAAYVVIPGGTKVKLTFGKQGTTANAPWFWTGTWTIPADYPLGLVAFKALLRTTTYKLGVFEQAGVAAAQLTVIAKP